MLVRRNRRYYIDLWIPRENKRIRRSLWTTKKKEALEKYKEKKEEILTEYYKTEVKFEDFCKQYLEWAWSSKPSSAKREEQRLFKICEHFRKLNITYLSDITPYHIEQIKAELKSNNLSKATINRYLQLLRGLFYKAIDWEVYEGPNPLKKVRFFKESPQIKPLSPVELRKVLEAAKNISESPGSPLQKIFHDMCILALNTGMRKSEILQLKWSDIRDDEITVKGKGDRTRKIPINKIVSEILTRQIRKADFVFDIPNRDQQDLLRRTTMQIKKRTGIDFHFHLLRHRFMTDLIERGVDFVTASEILGHSKISVSMLYSHTDRGKKKRAIELLEKEVI